MNEFRYLNALRHLCIVFVVGLGLITIIATGGGGGNGSSGGGGGSGEETYSIQGQVTFSGAALSNAAILLGGVSNRSTTTNASGRYTFSGLIAGNYTITPILTGYTFTPSSISVTLSNENLTGEDFFADKINVDYPMRALHMGGNWGGNIQGIKTIPDEYFVFLNENHVKWLGISVAIFNDSISDPTVRVRYRPPDDTSYVIYTFDDADLQTFITTAKQLGFKVFLTLAFEQHDSPSITDPTCNTPEYMVNRAYFGEPAVNLNDPNQVCMNPEYWWWNPNHPSHLDNVAIFWKTYTEIAVKYGTLAQQLGVDMFSIGTETDRLFRTRTTSNWPNNFMNELAQMVAEVRSVYSGLLTYDQHFSVLTHPEWYDGGGGNFPLFQDLDLDVVGISAYFKLATTPVSQVLSIGELETAWETIFQQYLVPFQTANSNKPIVFTEFGYTDSVGSPFKANSQEAEQFVFQDSNNNGIDDGREQQANIFQTFFNVNTNYDGLVHGAFIWGNKIFTYDEYFFENYRSFGIYGKPSEQIISNVYK